MEHDSRHICIYTKGGDAGETALFDGTRVSKADPRVDAYGDVDELASLLGLARPKLESSELCEMIDQIQRDLFALGSVLADPSHRIAERVSKAALAEEHITRLEKWIDRLDERLPPLRRFILAGGAEGGATLHLARAVCRRAERRIVSLGPDATGAVPLTYINRLSDLLFVMARSANAQAGIMETEW